MKTRKNFYLFIGLMVVLVGVFTVLISFSAKKAFAATTANTTVINNTANLSWQNGAGASDDASLTVGKMYGVTWIGEDNKSATAGADVINVTTLSNDGNSTESYVLTAADIGGTATQTWTAPGFSNVSPVQALASSITVSLAAGQVNTIHFVATVHASEANGNTQIYQCSATCNDAVTANAVRYTSTNGTIYGGNIGTGGAGNGVTYLSNTASTVNSWTVTVEAAAMTLAKSVTVLNYGPYSADITVPRPGALLTYKLDWANTGAASANLVRIIDTVPADLTYKSDSLSNDSDTGYTDVDDADQASSIAGTVTFCPGTGGDAPATGGTVAASATGTYYYQATVN